jgi:hypothetical protein
MTIPPKHLEEQSIRPDAGDYYQSPTPDLASRPRSSKGWRNMARTNIPLDPTKTGLEANRLALDLQGLIVGQDEAIEQIVNFYQAYLTGMTLPGRPIGSFLFLGPTGSGKTRIVEATAECLFNSPRAVIKIDCGEFQHSHEIAKLLGSPPGYLGHRETHALLTQEVLNQYHTETLKMSFVLFDEIEKASDALWNLFAGHSGQGNFNARRQQEGGLLRSHDLHDQQSWCRRNERIGQPKARVHRVPAG